jgi:hypothetical protein
MDRNIYLAPPLPRSLSFFFGQYDWESHCGHMYERPLRDKGLPLLMILVRSDRETSSEPEFVNV